MARVILAPYIKSISGKVGNLEFRTLKSGKTVVRARRLFDDDQPPHKPTPAEIAQRRRFGIVSSIVAEIQNHYKRIDQAAADRQKIWRRVVRHYERIKQENPTIDDDGMRELLRERLKIGSKHDETTTKPRFSRTGKCTVYDVKKKGGKNE